MYVRPTGRFIRTVAGTDNDGTIRYQRLEWNGGDVIADGATTAEGYGATPVDRAHFIVDTIRIHLARQACTRHRDDVSAIEAILDTQDRWCPACGSRLPTQ